MLSIATWNIHKGFSQFNRRMVVHELRERLRALDADIVFLQEVQGRHERHAEAHANWPAEPQHEFLAEDVWANHAYGRNMVYDHGHHGNAVLARFPILSSHNQDVTRLRFEKRGLLHCTVGVPDLPLVDSRTIKPALDLAGRGGRVDDHAAVQHRLHLGLHPLCDLAQVVSGWDDARWGTLMSRARAYGLGRAVDLLLALAQDTDQQVHHSPLVEGLVGHPGLHRKGHEDDFAQPLMSFVVVKLQPENLAQLLLEILDTLEMIDGR